MQTQDVRVLDSLSATPLSSKSAAAARTATHAQRPAHARQSTPAPSSPANGLRSRTSLKRKTSLHFDLLAQMMFGAVPLSQKGQSTKVHVLRIPSTPAAAATAATTTTSSTTTATSVSTTAPAASAPAATAHSSSNTPQPKQPQPTKKLEEQLLITKLFSISFNDVELILNWDESSSSNAYADDTANTSKSDTEPRSPNNNTGVNTSSGDSTPQHSPPPPLMRTKSFRQQHRRQTSVPDNRSHNSADTATMHNKGGGSCQLSTSPNRTQSSLSQHNGQPNTSGSNSPDSEDGPSPRVNRRSSQPAARPALNGQRNGTSSYSANNNSSNSSSTKRFELQERQKAAARRVTRSMFAIGLIISAPLSVAVEAQGGNGVSDDCRHSSQLLRQFVFANFDCFERQLDKLQAVVTRAIQQSFLSSILADRQLSSASAAAVGEAHASSSPSTSATTTPNATLRLPLTRYLSASFIRSATPTQQPALSSSVGSDHSFDSAHRARSISISRLQHQLSLGRSAGPTLTPYVDSTNQLSTSVSPTSSQINLQSSYGLQQDSACMQGVQQLQDFVVTFYSCPRLRYPFWLVSSNVQRQKSLEACARMTMDLTTLLRSYDTDRRDQFVTATLNAVLQNQSWARSTAPTKSPLRVVVVGDTRDAMPLLNLIAYIMHKVAALCGEGAPSQAAYRSPRTAALTWDVAAVTWSTSSVSVVTQPPASTDEQTAVDDVVTSTPATTELPSPATTHTHCLRLSATLAEADPSSDPDACNEVATLLLQAPYSLLGGWCSKYTPEMILQAVPQNDFIDQLKDDMAHELLAPHAERLHSATAIVADMTSWRCFVVQLQKRQMPSSSGQPLAPEIVVTMNPARKSRLVSDMLHGVRALHEFGQQPKLCMQHLNTSLSQLYSRAHLLRTLLDSAQRNSGSAANGLGSGLDPDDADNNFSFLTRTAVNRPGSTAAARPSLGSAATAHASPLKLLDQLYKRFGGPVEGQRMLCEMLSCTEADLETVVLCAESIPPSSPSVAAE
ncbi:Folliculin-interacting protein 1 [Sorochytrium milnesiophthora]